MIVNIELRKLPDDVFGPWYQATADYCHRVAKRRDIAVAINCVVAEVFGLLSYLQVPPRSVQFRTRFVGRGDDDPLVR